MPVRSTIHATTNQPFTNAGYCGGVTLTGPPPMRRITATIVLVLAALLIAGCSTLNAVGAMLGSQVTFTQPQLQQSLNRNFPKRYEELGGLVTLNLINPPLAMPHGGNRLRLGLD